MKNILTNSDVLQESLNITLPYQSTEIADQLTKNDVFIQTVVSKLYEHIADEKFKQELHDALLFEFLQIRKLEKQIKQNEEKMKHLDSKLEELEQYSRRNCLLIHGIPHIKGKDTDKVVLNFLKKKLDIELEDDSIDRSHRLKSTATTKNKPKPIIVKFVTHNDKDWVYYNKKKLKNQEYLITESLTSVRLQCMKKLKEEYLAKK